jgi:hypothetical protein
MNPIKSAIIQNSRYGVKDRCLSFDGVDDYMNIVNSVSLNYNGSLTYEFWIKTTSAGYIITKSSDAEGYGGWGAYVRVSLGRPRFYVVTTNPSIAAHNVHADVGNEINNDQWYHIAAVYSAANFLKLYINGVDVKTTNISSSNLRGDGTYLIQTYRDADNKLIQYNNGLIDEVRIWNHARTADQIKRYMNTRLYGTETGLIAYYPMNEGTGSTAFDKSTNSNDGTITGASWIKP